MAVPPPRPIEEPPIPPPPNTEPPPLPPSEEPPPPSFGVTLDSVVQGDSPVAVPVGNTLMTKERKPGPEKPAPLPSVPGPPPFSPVSELYIGDFARLLHEVKADYPREALQLGIGGRVVLRVGINRSGSIHSVKIVRKAGHGFDDAAVKAMWRFRFSPCRTKQGDAVDCLITYTYSFEPPR